MRRAVIKSGPEITGTQVKSIPSDESGTISKRTLKWIAVVAAIALGSYLLGFIPMWMNANGLERELENAKVQLKPLTLRDDLANAVISSRRGEYENARQRTSNFFTLLREEAEREDSSACTASQRETINSLLDQRDETITLLARNDPAAADKLSDLYYHSLRLEKRGEIKVSP